MLTLALRADIPLRPHSGVDRLFWSPGRVTTMAAPTRNYEKITKLPSVACQALPSGVPRNFFRGGIQQIQLRTEDRENGDLGAVAP